ncbi:hypothetical protein [Rossellomorea vietnamensis]|uniref:hypothetical protein n=1 Tax=Rossellomorea vietnamensis TaxID=218284 RepID=UPI001E29036B|nr:hypothetical protein [Rossellomorea vietnamensis]MCC5804667.1 hypothetical protein [Rossellomorea vietnamensis]
MLKAILKTIVIIGVILSLVSCSNDNKDEIATKAKSVAVDYMKEEQNIIFVPEDVEFTSAIGGGTLWVNGYDKQAPSDKYSVTINYKDNEFEVGGIGKGSH